MMYNRQVTYDVQQTGRLPMMYNKQVPMMYKQAGTYDVQQAGTYDVQTGRYL